MDSIEGRRTTTLPRRKRAVRNAIDRVLASTAYAVVERRDDGEVRFTCREDDPSDVHRVYQVSVAEVDDKVTAIDVLFRTPYGAEPSRAERRRGRRLAARVIDEVEADLERTGPADAEGQPRRGSRRLSFLSRLTGRRAGLAALALIGFYLVPVALVWGIARAVDAGGFDGHERVAFPLALALGLVLVVGLTVWLGGWFRGIDFGEEYVLTFSPLAGAGLGWLRLILQLGSLVLVCVLTADLGRAATAARLTSAETEALPTYVDRVPDPEGGEKREGSGDVRQNEYEDSPNATYSVDYVVPADFGVTQIEAWLRSPGWADGVDGGAAFGALRDIECDVDYGNCEAQAQDPQYTVEVRQQDFLTVERDGEPAALVELEVEYVEGG